jgi:hypothetical protein
MIYAIKERIGKPSLFCGRKNEMQMLLNWVNKIKIERAKSKALLGRRKSGKTAIMERLFNIVWNQNDGIVPFYYEMKDQNKWGLDFACEYIQSCLTQYASFLTRTPLQSAQEIWDWDTIEKKSKQVNNRAIPERIQYFLKYYQQQNVNKSLNIAVETPYRMYDEDHNHFIIMIDEIQYMTKYLYKDKDEKVQAYNLPGIFHRLVELRFCPMLVSGSYIGWMTQMMRDMFVGGRLRENEISSSLTFEEGMTAVYQYANYNQIELSYPLAIVINILAQSNPYYISSILETEWPERDFTSFSGIIKTFAYEIIDRRSELHKTWIEYISSTLSKVNEKYAKKILLTLSKEREKEFARDEILDLIGWSEDQEAVLEKKLSQLIYGDLITEGSSAYHYKGIADDVLYLIFYHKYNYEIYHQKSDVQGELYKKIEHLENDKKSMQSQINELKGRMLELVVLRELNKCKKEKTGIKHLKNRIRPIVSNTNTLEKTIMILESLTFDTIWMNYYINTPGAFPLEIDVIAIKKEDDHFKAVAFETKNRNEKNLPCMDECKRYLNKLDLLKKSMEKPVVVYGIYFSANGFSEDVEKWLNDNGIVTIDFNTWEK